MWRLTGIKGGATFIKMLFSTLNRGVERAGGSKAEFDSVNWITSERVCEPVEARCNFWGSALFTV